MLIGTKANIKHNAISIKINQTALELVSSLSFLVYTLSRTYPGNYT